MTKGSYSYDAERSQHSWWVEHIGVSDWHFERRGEEGMAHSCGFALGVIEGINEGPMRAIERSSLVFNTLNARSGVQYTGRTLFEARQ